MKKLLLILSIVFANFIHAQGQTLPYLGTPTVLPQSPTSSDIIKIITKVTTPNLGSIVDSPTFTVTQNPREINIRGCYYSGMLTAIQEYIDTLVIGTLPPGNYEIKHKAYLSSAQQHCAKIDSNMVMNTFTIAGVTAGLKENELVNVRFFPNPASDFLYLKNSAEYLNVQIYSSNGSLIRKTELDSNAAINIKDLPSGLYFISLRTEDKNEVYKFVKEN